MCMYHKNTRYIIVAEEVKKRNGVVVAVLDIGISQERVTHACSYFHTLRESKISHPSLPRTPSTQVLFGTKYSGQNIHFLLPVK